MSDLPHTSDFVTLALRQQLLSDDEAQRLSQMLTVRRAPASDIALEEGLLDAIEVDIITTLQNPHDAVPGYEFLALLGRGGMGVVYRARQKTLDRDVAVKTLLLSQLNHRDALARFEREARTIGKLQHPNIVAAYDLGQHQGRLFLAMELIRGQDLGLLIQRQKRLDEQTAWAIARQIAAGLAFAQQANIIHRDIKPANILVVQDSEGSVFVGAPLVKISDFGLSLLVAEDIAQTRLTREGNVVGTPNFMAPEQLSGDAIDCRADIYALGGTVYNMLTGQPPYLNMTLTQVLSQKVNEGPPDVRKLAPEVSDASAKLLARMMARKPAERIVDYNELLAEIDVLLQGFTAPAKLPQGKRTPSTRSRRLTAIICLVTILLFGLSAILAWQQPQPPPARTMVQGEWEEDLFRGASIQNWGFLPGTLLAPDRDAEGATVLALEGTAIRGWRSPTENYRLVLGVALHQASAVEIHFAPDSHQQRDCYALKITPERSQVLSFYADQSKSLSEHPLSNSERRNAYHSVEIERQGTHWWASIDGEVVGVLPVRNDTELPQLRLVATGGQAHFEGIRVEELTQPTK